MGKTGTESPMNWQCPSCDTTIIGANHKDALEHLFRCGSPEPGYRGFVYYGVLSEYREDVERLMDDVPKYP